jgi:hypothetical protein
VWVAGWRLHVDLRVSGRGSVRERRVAEVVAGAERLLDPRPGERRLEAALGELTRVDWRALRWMSEDEVVVAAVGGTLPLLDRSRSTAICFFGGCERRTADATWMPPTDQPSQLAVADKALEIELRGSAADQTPGDLPRPA